MSTFLSLELFVQAASATDRAKEAEHQTWREKQFTRRLLQEKDDEVVSLLEEAQHDIEDEIRAAKSKYEAKLAAEERGRKRAVNEAKHSRDKLARSRDKLARSKAAQQAKRDAERRGFDAMITQLQAKHAEATERMNATIDTMDAEMGRMANKHNAKISSLEADLEKQRDVVHKEKCQRRQAEQKAIDTKRECQDHVKAMDLWLMDMAAELKVGTVLCSLL